jgi:hypothetical protein
MKKKHCDICNNKINWKNDGMFLRKFLNQEEIEKLPVSNLCVDCKKELMFANLITII